MARICRWARSRASRALALSRRRPVDFLVVDFFVPVAMNGRASSFITRPENDQIYPYQYNTNPESNQG